MRPNWKEVITIVTLIITPIVLVILKVPPNQLPFSLGAFVIGMATILTTQIILIKMRGI